MEEKGKMLDVDKKQLHKFNIGQKVNIADESFVMKPYHCEGNAIDEEYIIGISLRMIYDYKNRINNTEVKYLFNERKNDCNDTTVYEIDESFVFGTEEEAEFYLRNNDLFLENNKEYYKNDAEIKAKKLAKIDEDIRIKLKETQDYIKVLEMEKEDIASK